MMLRDFLAEVLVQKALRSQKRKLGAKFLNIANKSGYFEKSSSI